MGSCSLYVATQECIVNNIVLLVRSWSHYIGHYPLFQEQLAQTR